MTAAVLLAVASCTAADGAFEPSPCAAPQMLGSSISAGVDNVLSALASGDVRGADSAAVRFQRSGETPDFVTPAVPITAESVMVPLLGLNAETEYTAQIVAYNRCATATSEALTFRTGPLPVDLPGYTAGGAAPSPGYVVLAAGNYGLAIDNSGRVVWYRRFANGPGLNFQPQPNGRFVARPNPPAGEVPRWVEVDALGSVTRSLGCTRGLTPRPHDFIAEADGSYWLLCDEVRTVDLSAAGRSADSRVMGTAVQHIGATGELLFEWSPFDHFEIDLSLLQAADLSGTVINWTHGNALDLDANGNLLLSFRNLNEITKVDTRTGSVVWRLGGSRNEFTFEDTPMPAFSRQHGVRITGTGLQLLDNLGEHGPSRAERYEVDETRRTVRLVEAHESSTGVVAQLGGSTQQLAGGRMLVSFGNGGSVEEYDGAGSVVWRIHGIPGYVFRAHRISSLYRPGAGDPR